MRIQTAQHEAAAVKESQDGKGAGSLGSVDAELQIAAGSRDGAFRHGADFGRRGHERGACLILGARIGDRERVRRRNAGSHVEQSLDLRVHGHVRYPGCGATFMVAMGKCVIGPVKGGNRPNDARMS